MLPFLDVKVTRIGNKLHTSVFRKPTFSGLGTSFFSSCCRNFKINGIKTLLHRAYNVSSTAISLKNEIDFLQNFFHNNGFPKSLVQNLTDRFLSKKLDYQETLHSVPKKPLYLSLPYFGHKSILLNIELTKLISEYFYTLDAKIILVNNFRIGSLFKAKDALPKSLQACVIYKYSCPLDCGSMYIGSTARTLQTRVMEHRGISNRTGRPLAHPNQSAPRHHSMSRCSGDVRSSDFTVIDNHKNSTDLRILESLYIFKLKPNLNETASAFPLRIVNH